MGGVTARAASSGNVVYVGPASLSEAEARLRAQRLAAAAPMLLARRGVALGWIAAAGPIPPSEIVKVRAAWRASEPAVLPGFASTEVARHAAHIDEALQLVGSVLEGEDAADMLDAEPYASRLAPRFELLAASADEGDPQEIETLEFDAYEEGDCIAENLWCKLSWLSYEDDDASLRFRFSFGLPGYEDVAADPARQRCAAELAEAVFPESAAISRNEKLHAFLREALDVAAPAFIERIVYFNAPDGGAQFHQDVERGHLGVVFTQMHGRTGWLALSKQSLMKEIQAFLSRSDTCGDVERLVPDAEARELLYRQASSARSLSSALEDNENDALEGLLNRCPAFVRQLVEHGHAYVLEPGDVLLLPQHGVEHCAWHTVFCLDDHIGHALSFAVREAPEVNRQ